MATKDVDMASRPGFCSTCYCEKCARGFFPAIRSAIKLSNGKWACPEPGCSGLVRDKPTLNFRRLRPCVDGCVRLKKAAAAA